MKKKGKKVRAVGILYLSLVGDPPDLQTMVVESPSYLRKKSPLVKDKYDFPYIGLIFPYQGLFFREVWD